jgi:hypothetical protein
VTVETPANQLSLRVVYQDEHLIQVQCCVTVDGWSGVANAYTTSADLSSLASTLQDFSSTLRGPVTWEAGADNGIGFVGLRFYAVDRSGHIRCHVRLASQAAAERPEEICRFAAEMPTEAGLIVAFVRQLTHVLTEFQGQAVLAGVSPA